MASNKKGFLKFFFELAIVIIGITIAFTLDRMNQQRTNKQKVNTYLELLGSDLRAQQKGLEGAESINRDVLSAYQQMLRGLENGEQLDELFKTYFNRMQSFSSFKQEGANTYAIMLQSGDVQLLESITLKSQLLNLETGYERIQAFEDAYLGKRDQLLDPLIIQYFDTADDSFKNLNRLNRRELQSRLYLTSDLLEGLLYAYQSVIEEIGEVLPELPDAT